MKKRPIDLYFESVADRMKQLSFDWYIKPEAVEEDVAAFCRTSGDNTWGVELTTYDILLPKGQHHIRISFSVRNEPVEKIFHQTSGFRLEKQWSTATVWRSYAGLFGLKDHERDLKLVEEAEVANTVTKTMDIVKSYGLPYFESFPDLKALDVALNSHPRERCPDADAVAWFRCSKGLIVAKLVQRPNYEELRQIYTEQVTRATKGFYLRWFIPLVQSLENLAN